jgi:AcrR family transcriptional regulator
MQVPYERSGRTAQKARTRTALIEAARELIAAGRNPTVEQAASAASISRTTAYRYFPNQRSLLVAAYPQIEARSLLEEDPPEEAEARFAQAADRLIAMTLELEREARTALRLSLDADAGETDELVLRRGRAIGWLAEALAPLRGEIPEEELRRLVLATRASCGIEALVWLTDVAGLSREKAAEVMRWSARALFQAATGAGPPH